MQRNDITKPTDEKARLRETSFFARSGRLSKFMQNAVEPKADIAYSKKIYRCHQGFMTKHNLAKIGAPRPCHFTATLARFVSIKCVSAVRS